MPSSTHPPGDDPLISLRIFLATSPDVIDERHRVYHVIEELNASNGVAQKLGFTLRLASWDELTAGVWSTRDVLLGLRPLEHWDVFIGVLGKRFGSSSGGPYDSGTEEEFRAAYKSWTATPRPHILFYRRITTPSSLDAIDLAQYQKVKAFFEEFSPGGGNPGLFTIYENPTVFEDLVRQNLTWLLGQAAEYVVRLRRTENYLKSDGDWKNSILSREALHNPSERPLRLDAAVPETVIVHVPFDLAVAVRLWDSPLLRIDELTRTRSGEADVEFPEDADWVDLRAAVHAPDCDIAGDPYQFLRLRRGRDSVPVYFSLRPQREGEIPIRVTLYQAFIVVGNARLTARTGERVAGQVETHTTSTYFMPADDRIVGVYRVLVKAFSTMDEVVTLARVLRIDLDELPGRSRLRKASELVAYCERHGRLDDLIAAIIDTRQNWMEFM